ncbi:hypothetical protein pb186bvf_020337 [Paramecium bursaria]
MQFLIFFLESWFSFYLMQGEFKEIYSHQYDSKVLILHKNDRNLQVMKKDNDSSSSMIGNEIKQHFKNVSQFRKPHGNKYQLLQQQFVYNLQMFTIQSEEGGLILNADLQEEDKYIKKQLLFELNGFNLRQIKQEELKIFLKRIGYVLNQGWIFDPKEKVQLFFGITKLLTCTNSQLRRLIYNILQMINVSKYIFMIIQSLVSDLTSDNLYLKQKAIKCISLLEDEAYIKSMKYILTRLYQQIMNTQQIQLRFYDQSYLKIILIQSPINIKQYLLRDQQHALNLLHDIKKTDPNSMLKILSSLKYQELTPLVKIKMMKCMREIIMSDDIQLSPYNLSSICYLKCINKSRQYSMRLQQQLKPLPSAISYQNYQLRLFLINQNNIHHQNQLMDYHKEPKANQLNKKNQERQKIQPLALTQVLQPKHCQSVQNYRKIRTKLLNTYNKYILTSNKNRLNFYLECLNQLPFVKNKEIKNYKIYILFLPQNCSYELAKQHLKQLNKFQFHKFSRFVLPLQIYFGLHGLLIYKLKSDAFPQIKGRSTQSYFDDVSYYIFGDSRETLENLQLQPFIIESNPNEY